MSRKRVIGLSVIAACVLLVGCNLSLIGYGISQGYGEAKIIWKARPVEEVMKDPNFNDTLRKKLILIQEVKRYAIDSLNEMNSRNFTTVYDQRGKPVMWVVTACLPFSFTPKQWHFPFVGTVSYKGFFEKKKAEKEREKLIKEGYDTDLGTASAWSTLGWFRDPVLSNILYGSEGAIAELIIHELTHATLYVKDSTEYNENLASFIGEKGAMRFLKYKFGDPSEELTDYIDALKDERGYSAYVLSGMKRLDTLYKAFKPETPVSIKKQRKDSLIRKWAQDINLIAFADTQHYRRRVRRATLNNAYFMSFSRYEEKQHDFEKIYYSQCQGDLKQFLALMKKLHPIKSNL